MKLLFDQNLSFKLATRLADQFPGSSQVRLLGMASASDRHIWDYAASNGFALVNLDADFSEMASLYGPPPQIIWLRCGNQPTDVIEAILRRSAVPALELSKNPDRAPRSLRLAEICSRGA